MENNLELIVKESGLETTKAQVILEKFQSYFAMAAEWEAKAKTINVTDETQTADMKIAKVGRLFLREKRLAIEKTRKDLKEQALREGKAIDGISNVLKALIVPIEEYLETQEKFIEIRDAKIAAEKAAEVAARIEFERIAAEKAAAEEQERVRQENIRLRKEAEEKEKALLEERRKVEAARLAAEAKARSERAAIEAKAKAERDKAIAAERAKAEAIRKEAEEKARVLDAERKKAEDAAKQERLRLQAIEDVERQKQEAARKRIEAEKLALEKKLASMITCPHCGKSFERGQK
jgi:hypothetical protein